MPGEAGPGRRRCARRQGKPAAAGGRRTGQCGRHIEQITCISSQGARPHDALADAAGDLIATPPLSHSLCAPSRPPTHKPPLPRHHGLGPRTPLPPSFPFQRVCAWCCRALGLTWNGGQPVQEHGRGLVSDESVAGVQPHMQDTVDGLLDAVLAKGCADGPVDPVKAFALPVSSYLRCHKRTTPPPNSPGQKNEERRRRARVDALPPLSPSPPFPRAPIPSSSRRSCLPPRAATASTCVR